MQEFDPFVALASLLSVFIVFLINRWLGGYAPAHLASDEDALDRLRQDFPTFDEKAALVSADGKSAVLEGVDGDVALVEAVGDRFITRMLQPGDISALLLEPGGSGDPGSNEDGPHLRLRLNDFTNKAFEVNLAAGTNGTVWHKRLSKFHNVPESAPENVDGGNAHE